MEFKGDAEINADLGVTGKVLSEVSFADDVTKTATLDANIYANNVKMHKGVVKVARSSTITADTEMNDTTLNFGDSTLTNNGNVKINGNIVIKASVSGKVNSTTAGGLSVIGDLSFDPAATLTLVLNDKRIENGVKAHKFTLMRSTTTNGNPIDVSKITVTGASDFIKWTPSVSAGDVVITSVDNSANFLKNNVDDNLGGENIDAVAKAAQNGDERALKLQNLFADFAEEGNKEKIQEVFNRMTRTNTGFVEAVSNNINGAENSVATRTVFRMPMVRVSQGAVTGVGAGDEDSRYGAWVNPFYSRVNQGARGSSAGYKNESYGASFGFDTKAGNDAVVGAAFTASSSYMKHKNFKSGDKTRIKSLLLSLYNMYDLSDNWFMSGSATIGTNKVHNQSKRVVAAGYEVADGKYSMTSFALKEMFGYKYNTEHAVITPMFGFKYSRVNATKYQETGPSFQDLNVSTKAFNKWDAVFGVSVSGEAYDVRGMLVSPEVHAFASYDLFNKTQRSIVKLGSADLKSSSKVARSSYDVGVGLKSEYNAIEYEASYDLQLASKRVGHQGALKMRVNF